MAKDKSLLQEVSDLFTEETLEDILRKTTGENQVKILSWDFGEASNKGDSYMSVLNRIKVVGEAAGKPAQVSLVVKSMPRNIARKKTFRSTDFFYNEITCYTKIFPKFKEFLKSKGQERLLVVPRCFSAVTDGVNDYIALEDVSVLGFGPVTRQNSLNFSQSSVILKALANFHSISFAYKDQKKEEFEALADVLQETYFTPNLYSWYKGFQDLALSVARDALAKEYPGSKSEERFNSWTGKQLYDKSIEFASRIHAPTSVITQGDAWAPNFLIRQSEGDDPIALVLDFQLSRCSSPALDIAFFIYTCTEKALRDDHYDDLLKLYHDELGRNISALGSDPSKIYPWDTFMSEIKEQSLYGILFAVEAIPTGLLDPSEAYPMDSIKGDEAVDVAEIWAMKPIKTKAGRLRLADVILHAVERNYL